MMSGSILAKLVVGRPNFKNKSATPFKNTTHARVKDKNTIPDWNLKNAKAISNPTWHVFVPKGSTRLYRELGSIWYKCIQVEFTDMVWNHDHLYIHFCLQILKQHTWAVVALLSD